MNTTKDTFKDMALSLLSCCSPPHGVSNNGNINFFHFLSLVHSSIFLGRDDDDDYEEVKPKPEENDQSLSLPMADNNEEEQVDGGLNRCATRLHAAGVTLKPPDGQRENTKKPSPTISSFNFDMSNRDLVRFFRSITMGVDRGIFVDYSSHNKMVAALNNYSASNKATEIPTIGWHYLTKILEDLFYSLGKFLRRRYNFAATFGLVLGVVQALYSILSYHQKK